MPASTMAVRNLESGCFLINHDWLALASEQSSRAGPNQSMIDQHLVSGPFFLLSHSRARDMVLVRKHPHGRRLGNDQQTTPGPTIIERARISLLYISLA